MSKYTEIKDIQPELTDCFFAFSNEQLSEGWNKIGRDKELRSGGNGLYGTVEGIKKLMADYDAISKRIGEECDPQEVYEYEYDNHECSYTNDDREAMKICISYFGEERAALIKRYHMWMSMEQLIEDMKR